MQLQNHNSLLSLLYLENIFVKAWEMKNRVEKRKLSVSNIFS